MKESIYHRMKDLPSTHLLGAGTATCAGCGGLRRRYMKFMTCTVIKPYLLMLLAA